MRYLGGKSKIRKQIATFLESVRKDNQTYYEPFCGGGWVLQEIKGKRFASDGNKSLISMYQALQDGWIPPDFVTEEEYKHYQKNKPEDDPMTAFCGFGCSFAGKWFGGYARSDGKTCYAGTTQRSLLKQLPLIKDVDFFWDMYDNVDPEGMLIYCDPPYQNTTNYGAFSGFDHNKFWNVMREWSKNNAVVISEYEAPDDFECVKEMQSQMGLSVGDSKTRPKRTEKLFMIR